MYLFTYLLHLHISMCVCARVHEEVYILQSQADPSITSLKAFENFTVSLGPASPTWCGTWARGSCREVTGELW